MNPSDTMPHAIPKSDNGNVKLEEDSPDNGGALTSMDHQRLEITTSGGTFNREREHILPETAFLKTPSDPNPKSLRPPHHVSQWQTWLPFQCTQDPFEHVEQNSVTPNVNQNRPSNVINAAFLPQMAWQLPFSATPNLRDDKYGCGAPRSSPRVLATTTGINSEPNCIWEEMLLGKIRHEQDRKNGRVAECITAPVSHFTWVPEMSRPIDFLPRNSESPNLNAGLVATQYPTGNHDKILWNTIMYQKNQILQLKNNISQFSPSQAKIYVTDDNVQADVSHSMCMNETSVATPQPPLACTSEGKSDFNTPSTTQKDRSKKLKSEGYTNFKSQNLSAESTINIQEGQPKHNLVQIKCPVKLNRDEKNLNNLGYVQNEIVQARSPLNPLYSTLAPFTPEAVSLGGIPMVWVCNICGMAGYRSHFEASAHEVKCKASIQTKSLSTRSTNCRTTTDYSQETFLRNEAHSNMPTLPLYQRKKETSAEAKRIIDLDHRDRWEARCKQLSQYKKLYGDCCVPQNYPEDPGLGLWVKVQRRSYKLLRASKQSPLSEERLKRLDKMGFVWDGPLNVRYSERWKDKKQPPAHPESWNVRFQQLRLFWEQYGHCRVPQGYPVLGLWVKSQRMGYRHMTNKRKSSLTIEKLQKLQSIGFEWRLTKQKTALTS